MSGTRPRRGSHENAPHDALATHPSLDATHSDATCFPPHVDIDYSLVHELTEKTGVPPNLEKLDAADRAAAMEAIFCAAGIPLVEMLEEEPGVALTLHIAMTREERSKVREIYRLWGNLQPGQELNKELDDQLWRCVV